LIIDQGTSTIETTEPHEHYHPGILMDLRLLTSNNPMTGIDITAGAFGTLPFCRGTPIRRNIGTQNGLNPIKKATLPQLSQMVQDLLWL